MRIYWNDGWRFTKQFTDELTKTDYDPSELEQVRIPHSVVETPYNYFDPDLYEMVSGYRREFTAPEEWREKNVIITFEGAAHEAVLFVNGQRVLKHKCGYTAFSCELNKYLKYGEKNVIALRLDSRETLNQPPFGNVIDYMTYGGVYRDVYIDVHDRYYIKDVELIQEHVLDITKILRSKITLNEEPKDYMIRQSLLDNDGHAVVHYSELKSLEISSGITDVELWSPEQPKLYILKTELLIGGMSVDVHQVRIGFREAVFKPDGFYLNGKKRKLRGLNRHQSYPYVGYAMPERAQKQDVDILINELGVNLVRTSHYPQSHYFLDACDEKGLMVFTEIPGWQHIGDEAWKEIAIQNVEEMVLQYKHHPSIILWGVRINESLDDDDLYEDTNERAHELDPSRQTGGVRYLQKSHLLEDVYTYNDFLHKGDNPGISKRRKVTKKKNAGYLISEFNGHMFPVKMFDKESVRLELALRTARVMNDYYDAEDVAGGCGWCMFDYNTHKDFGSGDRICYHGAMDMFRNPKLSATVYASQSDKKPYLAISSTMDIGEHPAGNIGTIYAFTNADSVKVYKNDEFVKEFKPNLDIKTAYPALPHAPIAIDDLIGELMEKNEKYSHSTCESMKKVLRGVMEYGMNGLPLRLRAKMVRLMLTKFIGLKKATELYGKYVANWGGKVTTYRFEAIKDGEVVATVKRAPAEKRVLCANADTELLVENHSYDVASIRISMRDENDNLLHYYQEPVSLRTEGVIRLIGPDTVSLKGGCLGTYVKTIGESGEGKLYITAATGEEKVITFNCLA